MKVLTPGDASDAFTRANSPLCLVIDDLRPAPGASLLANGEIYLDIENVRLEIENAGFENDTAVLSYLDPVIHERAVLTVEAPVADIEAEVLDMEARVPDIAANVPDTKAAGLNIEADVVIRVVASVI